MGAEGELREICGRPENEKPFVLMPVGFAAHDATVPFRSDEDRRKPLAEILRYVD